MALPPARIDDKIHAAKFKAHAGLVVSVEPHYCNILDPVIVDVQLSPVIVWNMGTRRLCEDVDTFWNLGNGGAGPAGWSYSPNFDPTSAVTDNLDTYTIDWGDGNVTGPLAYGAHPVGAPPAGVYGANGTYANEWPLVGGELSHTYTISITLLDNDGNSTTIEEQVEIVDCTVEAAFPFEAYAGLGGGGGVYRGGLTWTTRNTGLTGDWLTVNDLDINYGIVVGGEPEVWIATNAGLAYSRNGGATWSLIVLDDPPNSWADAPAPTAQSVTYYKIARKNSAEFIVLVHYKNAGLVYRGYMLRTEDNGQLFTWYNLGGKTQEIATWGMPEQVILPWWCDKAVNEELGGDGSPVRTLVNPYNILFDNGVGGGCKVDFTARPGASWMKQRLLLLDLGTYVTLQNATQDGGINNQWRLVSSQDTMTVADQTAMVLYVHGTSYDQWKCDCCISATWAQLWGAPYPFATPQVVSSLVNSTDPVRWLWVTIEAYDLYSNTGFHRHLIDWIKVYPHTVLDEVWPLSATFSKGTGRWLYMTILEGGNLRLRVYDTSQSYSYPANTCNMSWPAVSSIQIELYERWLGVQAMQDRSKAYMDRYFIMHGRFGWPESKSYINYVFEGTGLEEPIYRRSDVAWSDDSLAAVADVVGEVIWPTKDKVYLFVNDAGACEVHMTDDYGDTWTNLGVIGVGQVAHRCAMDNPDYWDEYIAGRRAAGGAPRVRYTMDDAANWFDTDTDLPANAVQVLRILSSGI